MALSLSLPREVREALDLHDATPDAGAVAMAAFRKLFGPLRRIHNRAAWRAGLRSVTVDDGPKRKRIRIHSPASDTPAKLAARFAVLASRRPDLLADEARRVVLGLKRGPRGLDEMLDPRIADAAAPRGLFGIDDAILIGVVVPLLTSLLPTLLPMIFQWGSDALGIVGPASGAPPADEAGDVPDDDGLLFGFPRENVIAAAVVAVVAVFALRG